MGGAAHRYSSDREERGLSSSNLMEIRDVAGTPVKESPGMTGLVGIL